MFEISLFTLFFSNIKYNATIETIVYFIFLIFKQTTRNKEIRLYVRVKKDMS